MANHSCTPEELQRRLLQFGVAVCREVGRPSRNLAIAHINGQLIRSATSPSGNYAEACGAQSRRDFGHKVNICLKELRESWVWLQYTCELLGQSPARTSLTRECDELISIFVASLKTLNS